jgi:enoyl-CoA hydratase/carnithine racemase
MEAFLIFDKADTADVAVFWGEGGAFCAGADLKRVATGDNKKMRGAPQIFLRMVGRSRAGRWGHQG